MSKSQSAKKKKYKAQTSIGNKTTSWSFEKYISYKHAGLIFAAVYLVIVGLISFIFHTVGDYGIETDFFWGYVPSAQKFLAGEIPMDAFRGPLYPIVLAIFGFILGDFFHAGILIAVLSASVIVYITFELLKKIFSPLISFFVT
ncbi:MAG: hypothetical protein MUE93_04715, partial [Ignavibacteriaceae bacterium]|nr:hypothetical protein [Ignavibacteriaceae bacterium]